jgi:hypothetical protein
MEHYMRSFAGAFAFDQKTSTAGCPHQNLAAVYFAEHAL